LGKACRQGFYKVAASHGSVNLESKEKGPAR
jgi:hypothetical protein